MPFPNTIQVPIQFSGGLNSKIAEFSLDQPYLQSLQNGVYNLSGQIDKRTGFTCISTDIQGGGNISDGYCLTVFNNELILLDGRTIYSWQPEEQVWISRGTAFSTTNQQTRILNTKTATQSNPDCTSANGLSLYVWEDNRTTGGDGIRYSVINNQTDVIVTSDQALYTSSGGSRPKVVTDGTQFYLCYCASTDTLLYATVPVSASNTLTSNYNFLCRDGFSVADQSAAEVPYDALAVPTSSTLITTGSPLIAYASQTGVRFDSQHYPNFQISANVDVRTIAIALDSFQNIWVAYSDSSNTYVAAFQPLGGPYIQQLLKPTVINRFTTERSGNIAMIEGTSPGSMNVTCEIVQPGNNNYCNNYTIATNGISTFIGQMRGVGLASKPFKYGGNIFINTVVQSNLQATYFTQCLTQGTGFQSGTAQIQAGNNAALATSFAIVSKHAPQIAGNYRTNSLLSQADPIDSSNFLFAGQRKGPFTSYQNAATVNLGVAGYTITFNGQDAFNNVSANNNLHFVGGINKIYDGVSTVEDNFNLFPENADGYGCTVVLSTGGNLTYNPLTVPNQYQWIVVYEWTDNYGQVQRSGPSVAVTATTTTTLQSAILTGPTLRLTEKIQSRTPVIISIYRTQDSLPIFYKVTDDNNPLVNDTTTDTWTFQDVLSDVAIAANENLYIGSQLGNTAPPPSSLVSLYQQRLFINSTEDPGVIWFSQNKFQQDQYNTLALDWNTSFVEGVDSRLGNEITALGLLDSTLVIFKDTSIFLLSGDGPNALETSGQFNDATLLVSDTGCSNQNSLVFITQTPTLPGGLLFKSKKGIYLLGRDESLYYIGNPVERYNNLTITSANLLSQSNQVVFTTLEGTALVYNYFFNAWSTWENLPAISACVWQDQLCLLRPDGNVMVQDITNTIYQDTFPNGVIQQIPLSITTPWIKIGGLQGYQSVFACYLLGQVQGPHVLQIQTAYDYNPSLTSSALINSNTAANRWGALPIWGSNGVWGSSQFANYQWQINMNNPRCQAIQLTITDVNDSNTAAYSLNGLVLECLTQTGGMRLPTSNKGGTQ